MGFNSAFKGLKLNENVITQYQTETGSSASRKNLHTTENNSELFSVF
jgi:hypothetical protein